MKQGWPNGSPCGLIEKPEDMRPRPANGATWEAEVVERIGHFRLLNEMALLLAGLR
jgi:hypothetical protein